MQKNSNSGYGIDNVIIEMAELCAGNLIALEFIRDTLSYHRLDLNLILKVLIAAFINWLIIYCFTVESA
jgi:hypothetical protein